MLTAEDLSGIRSLLREEVLPRLDSLETGIGTVLPRLASVESGIGKILPRLDTLDSGIGKVLPRLDSVESGIGAVLPRLDSIDAGIANALPRLDAVEVAVGGVSRGVASLEFRLADLSDDLQHLAAATNEGFSHAERRFDRIERRLDAAGIPEGPNSDDDGGSWLPPFRPARG